MSFIVKNPDYKSVIREKLKSQYFMHHIGVDLSSIEPGRVEALIDSRDFLKQQNGFLHGGVTATLNDVVAGFAAFTLVAKDEVVVTADLRISYLHPGDAPLYKAIGWVVKPGNLLHFCESEVWAIYPDKPDKLISKSSSTMATVKVVDIQPR